MSTSFVPLRLSSPTGRCAVAIAVTVLGTASAAGQDTAAELLDAVEQAVAADNYAEATSLLVKGSAKAKGDAALQAEISELRREVGALQREFTKTDRARETLVKSPEDPAANLSVGEFYAFAKGDWEKGLPLLAFVEDEELQAAAKLDLANPDDTTKQIEAGDSWHAIAEMSRDESKSSRATLRARHWYLLAAKEPDEVKRQTAYDRLDQLRLHPTKLVVVNSHNGRFNDRGTLLADVKLLLDDRIVMTRRVTLPWKAGTTIPVTIRIAPTEADAMQVDVLKWHNAGGALAEIKAYQDGVNLARGGAAKASAIHHPTFDADRISDGAYDDVWGQDGIWMLPNAEAGWVRVDFKRPGDDSEAVKD